MRRLGGDWERLGHKVLLKTGMLYRESGVMPAGLTRAPIRSKILGVLADVWVPLALVAKTAGNGENISCARQG